MSEMDTVLDRAQEEAMPLVDWALTPMGHYNPKEEYANVIAQGSCLAATNAGPISRAVDAISCRLLERGCPVSRVSATGLLSAAGVTPTVGSFRGGLLESACAIVPWLVWVPAVAERLLGGSIERKAGPFMGQGIRTLYKKDWAVRVVFGGEDVYSSFAKDFPNSLNREQVERPFLWRDVVPRQHVCSLFKIVKDTTIFPWTCM